MNRLIQFLRKRNDGYVSIEVVIVGGLIVGLSAFTINNLGESSSTITHTSSSTIEDSMRHAKIQ